MPYLFDTNHCIYLMNGWGKQENRLTPEERNTVGTFSTMSDDIICMSEASVGELFYGTARSQRKEYNINRLKILLSAVPPLPVIRDVWEIFVRENWAGV